MAKFPLTVAGTKTVNADGSITLAITVTDGNLVQVATASPTYQPNYPDGTPVPISVIVELIRAVARDALNKSFVVADLPASFSFNFSPMDLL